MSKFCVKCGAALWESSKFCTSCGAGVVMGDAPIEQAVPLPSPPVEAVVTTATSISQCSSCGYTLAPGKQFCAGCGKPVDAVPVPVFPAAPVAPVSAAPPSSIPQTPPGLLQPELAAQPQHVTPRAATPIKATALIIGVALLVATSILSLWPLRPGGTATGALATGQTAGGAALTPQPAEGVKTDATLADLVGEWEGTVKFTRMDGFENLPEDERPGNLQEIIDEMLSEDHPFTLEITEDGEWDIFIDLGTGLGLDSRVALKDGGGWYTPNEMLILPFGGSFSTSYTIQEDEGSGTIALSGEVFDEDDLRVAGKLHFGANMGGISVIMEGDYNVIMAAGEE